MKDFDVRVLTLRTCRSYITFLLQWMRRAWSSSQGVGEEEEKAFPPYSPQPHHYTQRSGTLRLLPVVPAGHSDTTQDINCL